MSISRRYAWLLSAMLAAPTALGLAGCKKASKVEVTADYAVGEKVDVKWNGKWWKAEILSRTGPSYRVHYTGWSARWDEDVTAERIRPSSSESGQGTEVSLAPLTATAAPQSPAAADAGPAAWKVGDKVDVQWNGSWWAAEILALDGDKFRVHYTGWASSWDESVAPSRIRAATPGAKRGSGK